MNAENVGTVPAKRSALSESLPLGVGVDLAGTQIRAAVLGGPTLLSRGGLFTEVHSLPDRVIPRFFQTVQQALDGARITRDRIAGRGMGAPGPLHLWTIPKEHDV